MLSNFLRDFILIGCDMGQYIKIEFPIDTCKANRGAN